jgi:type I restriction enzyme M protein
LDNLPAPDEIAQDIVENLKSALEGFESILNQLNEK